MAEQGLHADAQGFAVTVDGGPDLGLAAHPWVLIVCSLWHQIYVERAHDPIAHGWEKAQGAAR